MAFNVKRGRGRPVQEIKTRSFKWATPKGFKLKEVDYSKEKFVFEKA